MSQIKQIKEANDIVDIIKERLNLKAAGSSYKALCPFHHESTPSFYVSSQLQRYKCFGCGQSGDVINFLQDYEGMTFYEALKYLADRVGIKLKQYQKSQDDEQREQLLEILRLSSQFFHYLLTEHQVGKKARKYLQDRNINNSSVELFKLGYAPQSWDSLLKFLHQKKNFSKKIINQAGLVVKTKNNRYYDRFRGRLIFPLRNHRGQVVGFSGRVLDKKQKNAKYINTPETELYHKSKMLFGYHELFHEIRKKKEVIIVEGEVDVITSSQAHVNHIVAIKGSALTDEHAKLLKRVVDRVLLCLDTDEAGIKATKRAIPILNKLEMELRVIDISEVDSQAKDPDEIIRKEPGLWRKAAHQSISVYDFLIKTILTKYDAESAVGKRKIIQELAPSLVNITSAVETEFYLKKLASKLNVRQQLISQDIKKFAALADQDQSSSQASKFKKVEKQPQSSSSPEQDEHEVIKELERMILHLLLKSDALQIKKRARLLKKFDFDLNQAAKILSMILKLDSKFSWKSFSNSLAEDLKEQVFNWYYNPDLIELLNSISPDQAWTFYYKKFKKQKIAEKISQVNEQIEELDRKKNKTEAEEQQLNDLLGQIVDLQRQLQ